MEKARLGKLREIDENDFNKNRYLPSGRSRHLLILMRA